MSESNDTNKGGVSTIGLLGVVFIVLKLTAVIDWSWCWVTLPFWGPVALVVLAILAIWVFRE